MPLGKISESIGTASTMETNLQNIEQIEYSYKTPIYKFHQFQGNTNNCGPTSTAIAANAYLNKRLYSGEMIAQELNNWWKYFPKLLFPRINNWATFPWGIVQYLKKLNISARWGIHGNLERLKRNILAERITIVIAGNPFVWKDGKYYGWGHTKVLFGYSPGKKFYFVDPGYELQISNSLESQGIFCQTEEEFLSQWKNFFNIYIELE
jgi:hypothetical protein